MFLKAFLSKLLGLVSDVEKLILKDFYILTLRKQFQAPEYLLGLKVQSAGDSIILTDENGIKFMADREIPTTAKFSKTIIDNEKDIFWIYKDKAKTYHCKVILNQLSKKIINLGH